MTLIAHRYRLEKQLGAGGMGAVYRAFDRLTRTYVALKRVDIPPDLLEFMSRNSFGTSSGLSMALAEEFKSLANLRHPHIISVLDYGFDVDRQPFYTMELLRKPETLVAHGADKSLGEKIRLIIQVLQALAYLHRRGIIHRDLKPDNALVVKQQVKVLDFGLAISRGRQSIADTRVGTFHYMAPEVLAGNTTTESADLYAIGVMAFELLAGKYPFDRKLSLEEQIGEIIERPPNLALLTVSDDLTKVIAKLLAKTPGERYANALDVIAALCEATGQSLPLETTAIRESFIQSAEFVGRRHELDKLKSALVSATEGKGSSWLIGGESGVGKSRLMDELRTQALVEGALVLRGQAVEGGGLPYQLWHEPLRRLLLLVDVTDLEASILKPVMTDIEKLLERPVTDAPELSGEAGQIRLIQTIVDLFKRIQEPVLLLLEDLHWSSESLRPLQTLTTTTISDLPLVVVGNYRSDERPDLPQQLGMMESIVLQRLSKDEITQLSVGMLGEGGRDPMVVERLREETEGNTFFMVEVVRALAEQAGRLGDIGSMTIPRSILAGGIQKIIQRRLDRVPEWGQPLLRLAAVAGRQLDLAVLGSLIEVGNVGFDQSSLNDWLTTCADAAILDIQDERWRFSHDKLRETLRASIGSEALPNLHRQVATALENAYADEEARKPYWEPLLAHWQQAGDPAKEVAYALLVGSANRLSGRFQQNKQLMEHVLGLCVESPDIADAAAKANVYRLLGNAARNLTEYVPAVQHYQSAITLATQVGDEGLTGILQSELAETLVRMAKYDEAKKILESAIVIAHDRADSAVLARSYRALGMIQEAKSEYATARDCFQKALVLFGDVGDREGEARTLNNLGVIHKEMGEYLVSIDYYQQSLVIAKTLGDKSTIGYALGNIGAIYADSGNEEKAIEHYMQSLAIRRELGDRRGVSIDLINLSFVAIRQNDWEQAALWSSEAYHHASETSEKMMMAIASLVTGQAAYGQGDRVAARECFEQGVSIGEEIGLRRWLTDMYHSLGDLDSEEGAVEDAHRHYMHALELARAVGYQELKISLLGKLALNQLARGQTVDAHRYLLEGAQAAAEFPELPQKLEFLETAAEYFIETGCGALATRCVGLIAAHPKSTVGWRTRLDALRAKLPTTAEPIALPEREVEDLDGVLQAIISGVTSGCA